VMAMDDAVAAGAMALFGEKYGDEVRVLAMGENDFSVELCGGTHVGRTGDIGLLRIVAESGVASGVRRIEGVTGSGALALIDRAEQRLAAVCDVVKGNGDNVVDKVAALRGENRELEKEIARLKQKLATSAGGDLTAGAVEVAGIKVLAANVEGADAKSLRDTLDQCKNKLGSGVILLAAITDDKVALAAGVTADLTGRIRAGDLMREMAQRLGGKGGGRPDMAQGGGTDVAALPSVLKGVPDWVAAALRDAP
ncbi:MAG: DHHA1 domain-containing protein, partial [Gammaproteobacteria bacterium]|nr:DHHA1 domain-containing protein [Gammaproteobacteria bacterium]